MLWGGRASVCDEVIGSWPLLMGSELLLEASAALPLSPGADRMRGFWLWPVKQACTVHQTYCCLNCGFLGLQSYENRISVTLSLCYFVTTSRAEENQAHTEGQLCLLEPIQKLTHCEEIHLSMDGCGKHPNYRHAIVTISGEQKRQQALEEVRIQISSIHSAGVPWGYVTFLSPRDKPWTW